MACTTCLTSKRAAMRTVAPAPSAASTTLVRPKTCDRGSAAYTQSRSLVLREALDVAAANARLRCVNMTPLGCPVVPVV
ncbi:hypothetical protein D3C87_2071300 [compost metagenome]